MWTSPPSLSAATLYLLQPSKGLNVTLFSGDDLNTFDWTVGSSADGNAAPIPPGAGYQLALVDASPSGDRVLNATSQPFDIFVAQPSITIDSMFDGACGARPGLLA